MKLIIHIFNDEGREMLNIKYVKTTRHFLSQVDLTGQGPGIYLISLYLDQYNRTSKIIIE